MVLKSPFGFPLLAMLFGSSLSWKRSRSGSFLPLHSLLKVINQDRKMVEVNIWAVLASNGVWKFICQGKEADLVAGFFPLLLHSLF